MKRSEINSLIVEARSYFLKMNFKLPPVAYWSPEQILNGGPEVREIIDVGIGWDLTDFGSGDFRKTGLLLFTLRNGSLADSNYSKTYAEKIMIVQEGQLTPTHYHWKKTEDIINRGGGNLIIKVNNATSDDKLNNSLVAFSLDGVRYIRPAGTEIKLAPGDSITLTPGIYHSFWGEAGNGTVLVGEVSSVNDDRSDNCCLDPQLRFPEIDEDALPIHLLVSDYRKGE